MSTLALNSFRDFITAYDPAGDSKTTKKTASRSSGVTVTYDDLGRIFVLEDFAKRISTNALVASIYAADDKWSKFGRHTVYIEQAGQQMMFISMVIRDAALRGRKIRVLPSPKPTTLTKDDFIRVHVQKALNEGRLFVQPEATELRADISAFPQSPMKDRLDALAHAIRAVPPLKTRRGLDSERISYAEYLRSTGAPPDLIADALSTSAR